MLPQHGLDGTREHRRPAPAPEAGVRRRRSVLDHRGASGSQDSSTAPSIAALLFAMLAFRRAFDLQSLRYGLRRRTLAAFTFALATGVTTLETDLAVKDGVLVLSHDPTSTGPRARPAAVARQATRRSHVDAGPTELYDIGRLNPASAHARQFPSNGPKVAGT